MAFKFNASSLLGNGFPIKTKVKFKLVTFDKSIFKTNWKAINEGPLKRAGLMTRKIMIQSIKKARTSKKTGLVIQRPSKVGKPPRSRAAGHPFKEIFSKPDALGGRVLIGHVGWRMARQHTPMEMHEFGKSTKINVIIKRKRKYRGKRRQAARAKFKAGLIPHVPVQRTPKSVKMPKRPFALPALEIAKTRLPELWRDSISKSGVRN